MRTNPDLNWDNDEESGGQEGGTTDIVFRFNDLANKRDDQLPQREIDRLLLVERDIHKALTDKQKELMKQRHAQKEGLALGRSEGQAQGYGTGHAMNGTELHPLLAKTAQFSGAEKQVVNIPLKYDATTNEADQNKLIEKYENKYKNDLKNAPKLDNPYLPKLTR